MFDPDFSFLKDKNKIEEALKLNTEFQNVYMNCDEWSYDDCRFHIRLQFSRHLKYLTEEEYLQIEKMF